MGKWLHLRYGSTWLYFPVLGLSLDALIRQLYWRFCPRADDPIGDWLYVEVSG